MFQIKTKIKHLIFFKELDIKQEKFIIEEKCPFINGPGLNPRFIVLLLVPILVLLLVPLLA